MPAAEKPSGRSFPVPVPAIIFAVLVVIGLVAAWFLSRPAPPPPGPVLTQEARAYVKYLRLSDTEMKAHKSYLNQRVVEITGKITNTGPRALRLVEINCVFYDPYGQVVLRQRVPIVGRKGGGLKPGETKPFRLAFDELPESWNQGPPQLVIAQIIFEDR
ncbi:MAG: FxLYD domain-containing protein [Bryobacteraceae bacterium]